MLLPCDSLRLKSSKKIKEKYKDLFPGSRQRITKHFEQRENWKHFILYTLLIFLLFLMIPLPLSKKTASTLVDQRTSNVATIISMTLAIVGFLLSNIAIKEPLTYQLLFRKSKMMFIVCFALTTICCLMVTSTLRDQFPNKSMFYGRFVLSGTIMAVMIPLLIGYLFWCIAKFVNAESLHQFIKDELFIEEKHRIRIVLMQIYSDKTYTDLMRTNGIARYSLVAAYGANAGGGIQAEDNTTSKLIYDIDLWKLGNIMAFLDPGLSYFYQPLSLNQVSNNYTSYLNPAIFDSMGNAIKLKKAIKTKSITAEILPSRMCITYYVRQYELAVEAGDFRKVEKLLIIFSQVAELEMIYK